MRRVLVFAAAVVAAWGTIAACSSFSSEGQPPGDDAGDGANGGDGATDGLAAPSCTTVTPGQGPPPLHPEAGPPETNCGSASFDLETNAGNCGTCGRVCAESTCVKGACEATILAQMPIAADVAIPAALFGDQIVFHGYYSARAVALDGGDPREIWDGGDVAIATDGGAPVIYGVRSDDQAIWILSAAAGQTFVTSIGPAGPLEPLLALGATYPTTNFAVVGDKLFFVGEGPNGYVNRIVYAAPKSGGPATAIANVEPYAEGLAAEGSVLFWAQEPGEFNAEADGQIVRYDVGAGGAVRRSVPVNPGGRLAADSGYVYYFDQAARAFRRLPQDLPSGAQPETLATWLDAEDSVYEMTVAGDYLYAQLVQGRKWQGRVIVRVPRCGGEPVIVARDESMFDLHAVPLVVDNHLFFGNSAYVKRAER